jgi:cyclopropane-fatty-acyl-phospholipid synthase
MSSVANRVGDVLRTLLGDDPRIRIRLWDGSVLGGPSGTELVVRSPDAFRRLLYAPGELGLGRAYVAGDIDVDGDMFDALALRDGLAPRDRPARLRLSPTTWIKLALTARDLGALGRPLPPPPEEARLRGRLHSKRRDAAAIAHHYDVSNDFYRLVLGETMTYSCAFFETESVSLDDAQRAKYELICRKLALRPGMRLLDVGCGWAGMVMHAAQNHGVEAVGVTVSRAQRDLAEKRVVDAGLADRVEIRLQDYRVVADGPYDAISSIGMFEHVGLDRLSDYFSNLFRLLAPRGLMLNHAISRPSGRASLDKNSFAARYVFPDGELHEVGTVVTAMQEMGFEVRHVESLREHYALTLRAWARNLERDWDDALRLVGAARARIWRLYMAASALNFEAGRMSVHQVLGVKRDAEGSSGFPLASRPFFP